MKKRANGSGTIGLNKARRLFEVRVIVNGRRRKVSGPTQKETWARANELKAGPPPSDYSVGLARRVA